MARKKKTPFPQWQTCKPDGIEDRYIRLGNSQMLHESMRKLGHAAYRLYINMLLESAGNLEFTFPLSKYKSYLSKDGFQKAKQELIDAGFIEIKESNGNLRKANVYRFSDKWKTKKWDI